MKTKLIIATLFSVFLLFSPNVKAASYADNQTVDSNKTWTVRFTSEVGFDDVTKQGITVTDSKGNIVPVVIELGQDSKTVIVTAPQGGYTPGQSYILNVGHKAHSNKGKVLKNEYKLHFDIKSSSSNINIVNFKDKNLEKVVRDSINKPIGDIYKSDVEKITQIKAKSMSIQDISGIEYLINLQSLDLSDNPISDVSALKCLTNLTYLFLRDNYKVTDISMLEELNKLKTLDNLHKRVATNVKAKEIINKVIKPNMSDLQKELAIHDYLISNVEYDWNNYLKDTVPDDCYTDYGALVNGVAVCLGYAKAMNLLLNEVGIETITITGTLNLARGQEGHSWNIVKMEEGYYHIDVTRNKMEDHTGYKYFNISDKQMSKDHKWNSSLYPKCNVSKNNDGTIVTFDNKNFEKIVRDSIGRSTGDIYAGDIYKSDVEQITEIYNMYSGNDPITNLSGMENLTNLRNIYLINLQISDVSNLKGLTNLKNIDLGRNQISNIGALDKLTNLQSLNLCNNKIKDISALKKSTNLKLVDLSGNKIVDISALKEKTNLQNLQLHSNEISDISALKQLNSLKVLSLFNNEITDISGLKELTNLELLNLSDNKITDISAIKELPNLRYVSLSLNQISQIGDISALKGLINLKSLNLSDNKIADIGALKVLINLQSLDLSNNEITDISALKELTNLSYLNLSGNKITDEDKQSLKNVLPKCYIHF